ncbi:MAG: glycosyl hydrolase, partial [Clostridia bacterium]|nr:glycosyl hydrolase [Clostridia bacterium]
MTDVKALLKELTLEEKASLASGLFFWTTKPIEGKVPSVTMTDGPHGLRKEFGADSGKGGVNIMKGSEPATCFPPAVSTASSWDRS